MKKILIIFYIFIIGIIINANEIEKPTIKKLTINGEQGYFINQEYYRQLLMINNENFSLKQQIALLEINNDQLTRLNIQLKTQVDAYLKEQQTIKWKDYVLIGSISINVVSILGCIGLGVASWYLYKFK